jgi:hypothetical protein
MCHRLLFGTPGTMANVPLVNNPNGQYHTVVNKNNILNKNF